MPSGENKVKNTNRCKSKPIKDTPNQIIKLTDNVLIKCAVVAKLYGTKPIKLLNNIYTNSININTKKNNPNIIPICPNTILYIVKYIDSVLIDQPLIFIFPLYVP